MAFLAGCTTIVPVYSEFPDLPKELEQPCSELVQMKPGSKLSEVTKVIVENYTRYHMCSNRHDSTVKWVKEQKKIFESIKTN